MNLADALIYMGIKYGSPESIELIHQIGSVMINEAIKQSALLAKEQGTFPRYDEEAIFKSPFFQQNINDDVKDLVKEYGLRNSQVLTIAPTGLIKWPPMLAIA